MKAKKKFFKECHVAGRRYHDANEVWDELNVGTRISLVKDGENRYDPEAVALVYTDNEGEIMLSVIYHGARIPKSLPFLRWGGERCLNVAYPRKSRTPLRNNNSM